MPVGFLECHHPFGQYSQALPPCVFKIHITGIVCTIVIGLNFLFEMASTTPREQPVTSIMPVPPATVYFLPADHVVSTAFN